MLSLSLSLSGSTRAAIRYRCPYGIFDEIYAGHWGRPSYPHTSLHKNHLPVNGLLETLSSKQCTLLRGFDRWLCFFVVLLISICCIVGFLSSSEAELIGYRICPHTAHSWRQLLASFSFDGIYCWYPLLVSFAAAAVSSLGAVGCYVFADRGCHPRLHLGSLLCPLA